MTNVFSSIALLLLTLALGACATTAGQSGGGDYFPGGSQYYSYGVSQSKENFENVARAQSYYGLYTTERWWGELKPVRAPSNINALQAYYPLDVRWKLKDGREFLLESIDTRSIMREYFKSHKIDLPYQRENRPKAPFGDNSPSFVHEVKDDEVILKWLITINLTPVDQRFPTSGIGKPWKIEYEEHIVTTIKGKPTTGIDFDQRRELKK